MQDRFETFIDTVMDLNRSLQKIKDIEMNKLGLRAGHLMVLYYLGQYEEGLTSTRLTELCKEDKAAISRCVSQLSEKKLIVSNMPENKRSYRTLHFLTEDGRKVVEQVNEKVTAALNFGGQGLSDEERAVFYQSSERIRKNLAGYIAAMEQGKES